MKLSLSKRSLYATDEILDLECSKFAYHVSILIITMCNQNIFQLIIITHLKILKSLYQLTVSLGFYKSLYICRLQWKNLQTLWRVPLPSVSIMQNSVLEISFKSFQRILKYLI